jgi:hypothetical protein
VRSPLRLAEAICRFRRCMGSAPVEANAFAICFWIVLRFLVPILTTPPPIEGTAGFPPGVGRPC